jgi:pimeloyl-ACP methyl ester carboxylesterase
LVEPLVSVLARDFEVIVPEYPGEVDWFGVHRERMTDFVRWLDAVVGGLGLERPKVAGVSFGGAVALEYAARGRPLESLWVQGVSGRFRSALIGEVAQSVLGRFPISGDNPILKQMFRLLSGPRKPTRQIFRFILEQCWTTDQLVTASRIRALADFDVESRLRAVRCPVRVSLGADDLLVSVADARRLADSLTNASFEAIPAAGHLAFVTHPEESAAAFRTASFSTSPKSHG